MTLRELPEYEDNNGIIAMPARVSYIIIHYRKMLVDRRWPKVTVKYKN